MGRKRGRRRRANTLTTKGISKKGIATTVELIAVILVLFVSFGIFFPGTIYKNNWDNAYAAILSRDIVATLAATFDWHSQISFETATQDLFDSLFPESNLIFWYSMEGIKHEIHVACNCTDAEIQTLDSWTNGLRFNDRDIDITFCKANLGNFESNCIRESDALLILGYRDLQQYEQSLSDYLIDDKGIVELMDFNAAPDTAQQNIFGITNGGVWGQDEDEIIKPHKTNQITYQPYKQFYHLPLKLYGTTQLENPGCTTLRKGIFTMRNNQYGFWVCNSSIVYFDEWGTTDPNIGPLSPGDTFTLKDCDYACDFDFKLLYIDDEDEIRIAFLDTPFEFDDFVNPDPSPTPIIPNNDDFSRIFIQMEGTGANLACGAILNNISGSRTAWIADFARNGINTAGDDHRHLLLSMLIWASKKSVRDESIPDLQKGYTTSYIAIKHIDMFEIRKYSIGVGYPY